MAAAAPETSGNETVYRLETNEGEVQMSVEFFDRYKSGGLWFKERFANKRFCFSGSGKEDSNCVANFTGSIAIARYKLHAAASPKSMVIREQVRTIDHDSRLATRPPFERTIELQQGVASDIQAFGYQTAKSPEPAADHSTSPDPWCLLRQDLYFNGEKSPFLVVHWKHSLSAIRLLDVIPGDHTILTVG
jgi:hypothetical protein